MANSNTSRSIWSVDTPGPISGDQHVEAFGHQLAGLAHAGEGFRAVQLDLAGLAQRRGCRVDVIHCCVQSAEIAIRARTAPNVSGRLSGASCKLSAAALSGGPAESGSTGLP